MCVLLRDNFRAATAAGNDPRPPSQLIEDVDDRDLTWQADDRTECFSGTEAYTSARAPRRGTPRGFSREPSPGPYFGTPIAS